MCRSQSLCKHLKHCQCPQHRMREGLFDLNCVVCSFHPVFLVWFKTRLIQVFDQLKAELPFDTSISIVGDLYSLQEIIVVVQMANSDWGISSFQQNAPGFVFLSNHLKRFAKARESKELGPINRNQIKDNSEENPVAAKRLGTFWPASGNEAYLLTLGSASPYLPGSKYRESLRGGLLWRRCWFRFNETYKSEQCIIDSVPHVVFWLFRLLFDLGSTCHCSRSCQCQLMFPFNNTT